MTRSVTAIVGACVLVAACATQSDFYDARNPGDHCLDTCPEGMVCTGTTHLKGEHPRPGRCELLPGRCAGDGNCRRSQRCVRTGEAIGLCAEAPQI